MALMSHKRQYCKMRFPERQIQTLINYKWSHMCIIKPHEIYKIKTKYHSQINDIYGTYLPAQYKYSGSASSGIWRDCLWLIPVGIYLYIYIIFMYVELWLLNHYDFVYHYECHLSSEHWRKPRTSFVYVVRDLFLAGPISGIFIL